MCKYRKVHTGVSVCMVESIHILTQTSPAYQSRYLHAACLKINFSALKQLCFDLVGMIS